jgi:hypothetical protein
MSDQASTSLLADGAEHIDYGSAVSMKPVNSTKIKLDKVRLLSVEGNQKAVPFAVVSATVFYHFFAFPHLIYFNSNRKTNSSWIIHPICKHSLRTFVMLSLEKMVQGYVTLLKLIFFIDY